MRSLSAAFVAAFCLLALDAPAQAEKRTFIISNSPNAYGVDRCLADGSACGAAAASAYCHARQFAKAASYRRIERDEITGAVPVSTSCGRNGCDDFVAIECAR
jgi:hypothetical protein